MTFNGFCIKSSKATNHFQPQVLGLQHDDVSAMPQRFLKEITAGENDEGIFPKHH